MVWGKGGRLICFLSFHAFRPLSWQPKITFIALTIQNVAFNFVWKNLLALSLNPLPGTLRPSSRGEFYQRWFRCVGRNPHATEIMQKKSIRWDALIRLLLGLNFESHSYISTKCFIRNIHKLIYAQKDNIQT